MTLDVAEKVGWIQTLTGKAFVPCNPRAEDLEIADIAGALARQCRFAGHCLRFYSVAEHCCHVCDEASPDNKLAALMHDASEAYLVDIPRPIKPHLTGYAQIEDRLMRVIADHFGFAWPMPDEVRQLDLSILSDERAQNMAAMAVEARVWGNLNPPLGIELQFWSPDKAQFEFLARFYQNGGAR